MLPTDLQETNVLLQFIILVQGADSVYANLTHVAKGEIQKAVSGKNML